MADIQLSEVYNEQITNIFSIVTNIGLTIAILMFPFVLYIILTQSTAVMSAYKWQTVYYMVSSYCMEILFSVWKPVYLFPTPFAFSIGFTSRFGPSGNYIQFEILYFFIINMVFANYLLMVYRLVMIFGGYDNTIFKEFKYFFLFASSMFVISLSFIWIPLFFGRIPSDQIYATFTREWPTLASELINTSSLFGYSRDSLSYRISMYSIWTMLLSMLLAVVVLELYLIPWLKKMKKVRSDSTFKLQVTIYKVLNIQACLNALLRTCAGLWYSSSFNFGIRYGGPVITAWFAASSCHPILDSIIILYYIKPYRNYIKKKFDGFMIKLGIKHAVVTVTPSLAVSTYDIKEKAVINHKRDARI